MMKRILMIGATITISGCASNLHVWSADQLPVKGVPFRSAEVYVKQAVHDKLAKGGACTRVAFSQTVSLPTGALHFANVRPGALAKNGFTMKFGENGALTEIGVNSEPAAAESIKAVGEFLGTTLPLLGVAAGAPPVAVAAADAPACDVGEVEVRFTRLADYIAAQR